MSIDLSVVEATASEALCRTAVVESRVNVLESVTRSLNDSPVYWATEADLNLLRGQVNELYNIVHELRHSVEQLDSQLNALSVNQLL